MAEKKANGRPTDYKAEYDRMAYVVCSEGGFTDKKLALLFKCNPDTIYEWKKKHTGFSESIQEGKDEFDTDKVETALLKVCKGYRFTEKTSEARPVVQIDAEGNREEIGTELMLTKTVRKLLTPNVRGIEFWLRNRDRKRWPDTKDVKLGNDEDKPLGLFVSFPTDKHLTMAEWTEQVEELNRMQAEKEAATQTVNTAGGRVGYWVALRNIPSGATVSYGEIAEQIGNPKAARAVAGACASNNIAVAIPCHRVVRSDGELGGYRWGVERKRTLLERETNISNGK